MNELWTWLTQPVVRWRYRWLSRENLQQRRQLYVRGLLEAGSVWGPARDTNRLFWYQCRFALIDDEMKRRDGDGR